MKNRNHITFTQNLIKGRIAETIFERMFLATGNYTVLKGGKVKREKHQLRRVLS